MDASAVAERVQRIDAVCADAAADTAALEAAMVAARELTGWVEARRGVLVSRLSERVSFPEATIAAVDKTSVGAATKTRDRARTLASTPALAATLDDGATTAGHIDAVTRAAAQLPAAQRAQLLERVDALAPVAAGATVEQFSRRVSLEARRVCADDGMERLERQRRDTRLSTWVDQEGMWNVRGRFDPLTGVRLDAKLRTTIETLFAQSTPEFCPDDPVEKQRFLAAHAFAALIDGGAAAGAGVRAGRAEFVVVIDADAGAGAGVVDEHGADTTVVGPVVEWPIPVEIPTRVLADLVAAAGDRDVHTVVVRNGVVLHAPGELNLGRTTRLANRAQRRALRGLYATCAIPGCHVHYDRCKLHHIIWWRHGGNTDLNNLIPICSHHHHNIHDDGWIIELGANRELTLRLPDGTVRTSGPPGRSGRQPAA